MSNFCLTDLQKATEGILTKEGANELLQELQKRAKAKANARLEGINDNLDAAAKDIIDQEEKELLERKRQTLINIKKKQQIRDFISNFKSDADGYWSYVAGSQSNIKKSRDSLDRATKTQRDKFHVYLFSGLSKAKLMHVINDKSLEEELTLEMWESGNSQNPEIQKTASIIRDTYEKIRKTANKEGAKIGTIQNYVARQTHDIEKLSHSARTLSERISDRIEAWKRLKSSKEVKSFLREKSFQRWKDYILPRLDAELTFNGADPEKFLRGSYDGLVSGIHLNPIDEQPRKLFAFTGAGNRAKKLSSERVLHFKDGKSWFEYNKTYGSGSLQNSIMNMLRGSGRDIGLLKKFGTNPRAMFDTISKDILDNNRNDPKIKSKLQKIKYVFDEIDGTTSVPVNNLASKIGANIRAVQSMAKLGGVVLSSIPDLAIRSSALRNHGVGLFDGYADGLSSIFQGRQKGEIEEVADALGVWAESQAGHLHAYFSAADTPPGFMTKAMQTFFKFSGMEWWDEVNRKSFATFISRKLASQKSKVFSALDDEEKRILGLYGIGEKEWELIRNHPLKIAGNKEYVTPDVVNQFSDESIANYLGKTVNELKNNEIEDVKEDVYDNLMNYFIDQTDHANIRQEAADRAFIIRGTQPGTLWGEAARFIGQFKYFSIGYIRRTLGRLIYGHGADSIYDAIINGKGDITGLAQLIAGSTILGYVATSSKQLAAGLNPRDPSDIRTWQAAFLQGGGLSIYGDFLFGDYNRYGQGLMSSILGPSAGAADALSSILAQLRDGQDPANATFKFLKTNTPFINMFYTKMALDYLILYNIQERISPGSVDRLKHRIETQNNQTYWLPPTKALGVN